jgi:hypothetical protein
MLKKIASDDLNAEPPERRRDFVAEPPEAEHPVYPRQSSAKITTASARCPKSTDRTTG